MPPTVESAYHARALPYIGDFGSIDRISAEAALPTPELFIASDLANCGADGTIMLKAWKGVDCKRLLDDDVAVIVDSIHKARADASVKVTGISLRNHRIGDAGVAKLAELLVSDPAAEPTEGVRSLDLVGNNIEADGCAALCEVLKTNTCIESLNLSFNALGRKGGFALAEMLELNGSITDLNCGNCDLTTDNVIAVMSVMRQNQLIETLVIPNCRTFSRQEDLTKHAARMLEFNNTLVELNFDRNTVGDEGATLFAHVLEQKNKSLRHLSLSGNKIGVTGAESLASLLIRQGNLVSLNLSNNRICDDGAKAFGAALSNNKSLRSLNLRSNSIKDSGLVAIALGMQENSTLSELKLWGNDFDQDSCSEFLALCESRFDYFGVEVDFAPYVVDGNFSVAEL
jgi:Ran GTPase-activating protein (RanGAP) involved in mRNA processing and transport